MPDQNEPIVNSDSSINSSAPRILIVDDEADILELLELTLARMGMEVERAMNISGAKHMLELHQFDLCLTDMRLPDGEGLELVQHIVNFSIDLPVAVITAHGTTENAVAALKAGAFDYLAKPVSLQQLRSLVKSALNLPPLKNKVSSVSEDEGSMLLGESPPMLQLRSMVEKLSRSQAPVYINGESGSEIGRASCRERV